MKVSEIFESIQGEGASAGEPCVFLRLATCNLACVWCDTKYTWDWKNYRYDVEVERRSIEDLSGVLERSSTRRLVITGGEPMLQQRAIAALLARLPGDLYVEIETNGTLAPLSELSLRIDQWNVSPKLAHAGDPARRRIRLSALTALRDTERAWLKLVVRDAADLDEVDSLVHELGWPTKRILLMPQAETRAELAARTSGVERAARARGYGVSPRLHIELWNGRRGA